MSWAPLSVLTRDMSGNADSKQISTPIGSGFPARSTGYSRCAPVPGIMLDAAARLILVSQPSCCRNGMYSPNGTSRVLMYWPRMPAGLTSTPTFSWPWPGTVVSWLTSTSAPSWLARDSILASWSWFSGRVRSAAVLLSPHTIRSGLTPLSLPERLSSAVSRSLASTRWTALFTIPGCTMAIVASRVTGLAGVSANASGPAPTPATATAAPSTARPALGFAPGVTRGRDSRASTIATLTMTSAKLISHTPPTAASASTAGCCHWLTPNTAHGPPSACQDRSHSVNSQQLGTTTRAASARGQVTGGRSSFQAATPNGIHSAPTTAPTSSTAGPISGAIQYSAAIRYPAPSHQARIPPSRPVGDLTISTSPGTSPNQARNSRFGAGNARMSSAPRSSISRLGDQIHRPVLLSALRTLPLSAGRTPARDRGPSLQARAATASGVRSARVGRTRLVTARASGSGGYWGCGIAMTCRPAAAAERRPLEESSTAAQAAGGTPSPAVTAR